MSIVIATYNAEQLLQKALNSVLTQKYSNWECLIIDGASKDKTVSIIEEYEKSDRRIRHISEKDNGIYDAFNKGWKNAKGEWIYYLGSDDALTDNGLSEQMEVAKYAGLDVGVVNGGVIRVNPDGQNKICLSKGFFGSHQGMIMRRSVIVSLGGFNTNYKILADYDLFVRLSYSNYKVINTRNVLAYYNAGGTSEKIDYSRKIFGEKYRILKSHNSRIKSLSKAALDTSIMILGRIIHNIAKKKQ